MKQNFDFLRALTPEEYAGLKASLIADGQSQPIIHDQNGQTIDGHHRARILHDLGIPARIEVREYADDEARIREVINLNLHRRQSTAEDRKRLVAYLRRQSWTQAKIAAALGISQGTVSNDLSTLSTVNNVLPDRGPDTLGRKKSPGRPKARRTGPKPQRHKFAPPQEQLAAAKVLDEGKTRAQAAAEAGVTEKVVQFSVQKELGRREAIAEPPIDPATLKLSDRKRFDLAVKQEKRRLAASFDQRVREEIVRITDTMILPDWKKKIAQAQTLFTARRALMTKDLFNVIRRALHPDSRNSISDQKLGEAFDAFMGLEKFLLDEKASPTPFRYPDGSGLPSSLAEWDKMKAKATAARAAAKRAGNGNAVRPR